MAFVDPVFGEAPAKPPAAIDVDTGEAPKFVDPLGDFTAERPPVPTAKPRRRSDVRDVLGVPGGPFGELEDQPLAPDRDPLTTALGAFAKKAIPLPDWFLEGRFGLERPGQAQELGASRRSPVNRTEDGVYPTRDEIRETLGPIASAIPEVAGETVSPSAAMGMFARAAKPVTKIPGYLWEALRNYRTAPVGSLATDVGVSGVLGGGARGAAEEIGGVTDPAMLDLAQLGGELSPLAAYGAVRGASRLLPDVFGEGAARRGAQRQLRDVTATPPGEPSALGQLDAAEMMAPDIPGLRLQTGDLLDNPGLMRIAKGAPGRDEIYWDNARALRDDLTSGAPEGDVELPGRVAQRKLRAAESAVADEATAVRNAGEARAAQLENEAAIAADEARRAEETAARQLPGMEGAEPRKVEASERMRMLAETSDADARKHGGSLFEEVTEGVDPVTLRTPLYNTREAINRVRRLAVDEGREDAIPAALKKIKDTQGQETGGHLEDYLNQHQVVGEQGFVAHAPYSRTKGMRERLQEEKRSPATSPKTRRYLSMLLEGLNKDLDDSLPPDVLSRDRAARDYWRESVVGRFEHPEDGPRNPIADVLEGKPAGPTLVKPGEAGARTGRAFIDTFGPEPVDLNGGTPGAEAHSAMREWVLNQAGRTPRQVRKFVDDHAPLLENFPSLRRDLEAAALSREAADTATERSTAAARQARRDITETRGAARTRETELTQAERDLASTTAAGRFAKDDPVAVARQITSPREAKRARALFKRDPEAWAGLQRAYYDRLMTDVLPARATGPVKPEAIARFLKLNGKTMEQILDHDQVQRVYRVAKALEIQARPENLRQVPGTSETEPLRQQSMELLARLAGGGQLGQFALRALSGIGVKSAEDARRLVRAAAIDPEVFRELMREPARVRPAKLGLTVRGTGLGAGSLAGADDGAEEEGVLWKKLLGGEGGTP